MMPSLARSRRRSAPRSPRAMSSLRSARRQVAFAADAELARVQKHRGQITVRSERPLRGSEGGSRDEAALIDCGLGGKPTEAERGPEDAAVIGPDVPAHLARPAWPVRLHEHVGPARRILDEIARGGSTSRST